MKTPTESQRLMRRTPAHVTRSLAVLMFVALVAAACGSNSQEFLADAPPSSVDVEYGATVEEWSAAADESEITPDDTSFETGHVQDTDGPSGASPTQSTDPAYTDIEWGDLVPEGFSSDEVWAKYLDDFDDLEFGSPEEQALYDKVLSEIDPEVIDPALDGEKIRMNGFVAPITYDEDIVTEFLLVPYFGACIHVPAPPSNQTVFVKVDKDNGFTTDEAWGAVWIEGTLSVETGTNELGASSYTISGDNSGVYEQF